MLNLGTQEKALILGTGGASKAILYTLQKLGIECAYVSRSVREGQLTYSDLNKEIIDNNSFYVKNCIDYRENLTNIHSAQLLTDIYKKSIQKQ